MNIALIITGLGMGGAERQVCDLADKFIETGHEVLLITLTGLMVNRPLSENIKIVELQMTKTPMGFIKAYWQARRLIKQFKPGVVHSHMVHANIFSRLLRVTTEIKKLICTAHSSNEGGWLRMLVYRLTDRLCDISTNVSQEAVDILVKKGAASSSRMIAMLNGIDTVRFTFNSESRATLRKQLKLIDDIPLLLAVGRLTEAKDYPNLLNAFSLLPMNLNHAQLVIIGIGEEQSNIEMLVARLGLTHRVHFLGLQLNVHDWMSASDLFVLSSAWEGFGLVVAEAMACKRVVVATDCGGVKEVLDQHGYLVPPHDSAQLANAIEQAIALSSSDFKAMGESARKHIENRYSLSVIANKWLDLYQ